MTPADIYVTLRNNHMINVLEAAPQTPLPRQKRGRGRPPKNPRPAPPPEAPQLDGKENNVVLPKRYEIVPNHEVIEAVLRKFESKGYLKLRPDRLKYTPFLTTRDPALQRSLPAMTTTADDVDDDDDGGESDTLSSNKEEIISTPADPSEGEDTPDKIAAGEDKATLQLVAALASPARALRKRSINSNPSPEHPAKALRSSISASPANGRRRSRRGGTLEQSQSPRKAGAVPAPRSRRRIIESDDDDEWGEEDAQGEEEDYDDMD